MTVKDACALLIKEANIGCEHLVRTRWSKRAQRLSLRYIDDDAVHATTDFAATVALTAKAPFLR